jgi:hypothetical protein
VGFTADLTLKIEFDICDGQYKWWYNDIFKRTSNWYGNFVRSYSEKAKGFFKGFITALEQSNPGFKWAWDEKALYKCNIGLVLAYEEYLNKKQEKKERVYVAQVRSVDAIRKGDFKVPELKKLDITNATFQNNANKGGGFESMNMQQVDEDLPF